MNPMDAYVFDPEPADTICTLLSIGQPGLAILDDLYQRGPRNVTCVACLSDQERLLQSPVRTKVWSGRLTIFNTAHALQPLLNDRPTCLLIGPDARDLRITLALTEIAGPKRGVRLAFVTSPNEPNDEWTALLHELNKRLTSVFLVEPATFPAAAAHRAVAISLRALLNFLDSHDAGIDYKNPWRKSGRLTVMQIEASGPDRVKRLLTQTPYLIPDEARSLLATNPALLSAQCPGQDELKIAEYVTLHDALVAPSSNEWFRMVNTTDNSLPPQTIRLTLIRWQSLLP